MQQVNNMAAGRFASFVRTLPNGANYLIIERFVFPPTPLIAFVSRAVFLARAVNPNDFYRALIAVLET